MIPQGRPFHVKLTLRAHKLDDSFKNPLRHETCRKGLCGNIVNILSSQRTARSIFWKQFESSSGLNGQ